MIATKIENKLRYGFYRVFWNSLILSADDLWKGSLMQAIEENLLTINGLSYMPDLYEYHVKPGAFRSIPEERAFAAKIKDFIGSYASDFKYVLKNNAKVEVKEVRSGTDFPVFNVSFNKRGVSNCYYITIYDNENTIVVGNKVYFGKKYTIGRSDQTDIQLKHKYVSGIHAEMSISTSGQIRFIDMNSVNGTKLNSKRLESGESYLADESFHIRIAEIYDVTCVSDYNE